MSVKIDGKTTNSTSCELRHQPSGALISTTAPKDNGGDGSSFSPTDLFASSLGACSATILSMYAKNHAIPVENVEFAVEKFMASAPRMVSKIILMLKIKTSCSEDDFKKLVSAAKTCPVRLSLNPQIEIEEVYERI